MSESLHEKVAEFVRHIAHAMSIECEVAVSSPADDMPTSVVLRVPENAKLLIGKNGKNLYALEHVVRAMVVRHQAGRGVVVDVNDYRQTKTDQLLEMTRQAAGRVRDSGRSEALPPMTSYERRIVHTELASWSEIATESIGQDPQRRVVIKPL